jgi:hypothetical protein
MGAQAGYDSTTIMNHSEDVEGQLKMNVVVIEASSIVVETETKDQLTGLMGQDFFDVDFSVEDFYDVDFLVEDFLCCGKIYGVLYKNLKMSIFFNIY